MQHHFENAFVDMMQGALDGQKEIVFREIAALPAGTVERRRKVRSRLGIEGFDLFEL